MSDSDKEWELGWGVASVGKKHLQLEDLNLNSQNPLKTGYVV